MKLTVKRIDPAFPTRVAFLVAIIMSLGVLISIIFSKTMGSYTSGVLFFLIIPAMLIFYPLGTYIEILLLNMLLKKKGLVLDIEKLDESSDIIETP